MKHISEMETILSGFFNLSGSYSPQLAAEEGGRRPEGDASQQAARRFTLLGV
ncbi:MAG: hypothetical protein KDK59_06985 [Simkania sp.]|nr:hypothetical protein [Simkania sp.]